MIPHMVKSHKGKTLAIEPISFLKTLNEMG
jgi:hypothetical protein